MEARKRGLPSGGPFSLDNAIEPLASVRFNRLAARARQVLTWLYLAFAQTSPILGKDAMGRFLLAALGLSLVGCAPLPSENQGATLFQDNQVVDADFTAGSLSTLSGSRGTGAYFYTFRAPTNTFGPLPVVAHDSLGLTTQTDSRTCVFVANGTVSCDDGSQGTWALRD